MPKFGPLGRDVYERTYSRRKPDGTHEDWDDTVARVVAGNLELVDSRYHLPDEAERLTALMADFRIIPGGRFLWTSGVPGRRFSYNCHRSPWGPTLAEGFCWTFNELMKGGGVGTQVSNSYLNELPVPAGRVEFRALAPTGHPDEEEFAHRLVPPSPAGVVLKVEDSRQGWVAALRLVIDTCEAGGGVVNIDVTDVRPRGSLILGFGGTASGPGPLIEMLHSVTDILNRCVGEPLASLDCMDILHACAVAVCAGNIRRSARMSQKHWADEDIFDFISCKADDTSDHWSTNISVEIDAAFLTAQAVGDHHANAVYAAVIDGMMANGEPGFYNSTAASVDEPDDVRATNPCGEIPLSEREPCVLGHVNLAAFGTDLDGAQAATELMARFLLRATFAPIEDPGQRAVVDKRRRIGVGIFGYQEWGAAHGLKYSEIHKSEEMGQKLWLLQLSARHAAQEYAHQMGVPAPVKTTTVAPTGTISMLSGHTAGVHPVYARYFVRRVRYAANDPAVERHIAAGRHVEDCVYTNDTKVVSFVCRDQILDDYPEELIEQADELDPWTMFATQEFVQRQYANNAVSFTVNITPETKRSDLGNALICSLKNLKGTTVMMDSSRPQAPFERLNRQNYELMAATGTVSAGQAIPDCSTGACPVR